MSIAPYPVGYGESVEDHLCLILVEVKDHAHFVPSPGVEVEVGDVATCRRTVVDGSLSVGTVE